MTITPQFLDELRARLTLSDLIGGKIKLTRAGREFKACCPFHKEKSPSFYVNDDKQFFHCFGCGAHGDVVGFLMRHDNLAFPEAVEQLAAQAGMKMPSYAPEDAARAQEQKSLYGLMEAAAKWFEAQLQESKNADVMRYITGRGLQSETIAGFRLGYAPPDDTALYKHLLAAGFSEAQMLQMGLIKKREKDNTFYTFFRERVMFPVADRSGRIIAFGGRILPDHMRPPARGSDFKPPKYLNSPETPLFHKGHTVYAVAQARAAASSGQSVVVVEGYMDVIACHQAGARGVVAPLGTALTEEQIQLLWKMIPGQDKTITLCFDGDEAGIRAAARGAERILPLLKPDHSARIAFLPQGEDPDTLIEKRGVMAFHQVLEGAQGLADYLWAGCVARRNLSRPEERAGLEAELDRVVDKITDPKTKYHYQRYFREKLAAQFRPAPRPFMKGGKLLAPVVRPAIERPGKGGGQAVDVLLAILIQHPNIFHQVDEIIGSLYIDDPERDHLRQHLIDTLSGDEYWEPSTFRTTLAERYPDQADLMGQICSERVMVHAQFAKPGADEALVLSGFFEIHGKIQERAAKSA